MSQQQLFLPLPAAAFPLRFHGADCALFLCLPVADERCDHCLSSSFTAFHRGSDVAIADGLANAADFLHPTAAYEDRPVGGAGFKVTPPQLSSPSKHLYRYPQTPKWPNSPRPEETHGLFLPTRSDLS